MLSKPQGHQDQTKTASIRILLLFGCIEFLKSKGNSHLRTHYIDNLCPASESENEFYSWVLWESIFVCRRLKPIRHRILCKAPPLYHRYCLSKQCSQRFIHNKSIYPSLVYNCHYIIHKLLWCPATRYLFYNYLWDQHKPIDYRLK